MLNWKTEAAGSTLEITAETDKLEGIVHRNYSAYEAFSSDNSMTRLVSSLNTRTHKLNHLWLSLIGWSVGHKFIVRIARFIVHKFLS